MLGLKNTSVTVETRARTGNLARASLVEARPDLLRELSPRRMVLVLSERLPRSGEVSSPKRVGAFVSA